LIALLLLSALLLALASAAAPLLVYSLTLAVFGFPHVLYELRYVSRRFGPDLAARLRWGLAALLAGVLVLRAGNQLDWWGRLPTTEIELGLILGLCLLATPPLWRAGGRARWLGLGLVALFALGMAISPVHTLFTLAILHNWTPVGFVADALEGSQRRRALWLCGLLYGVVPLVLASGLPMEGLARLGLYQPQESVLPTGPLAGHLGAWLAPDWRDRPWTEAAFQALTYAQCMHYVAVIGMLPRLRQAARGWPARLAEAPDRRFLWMNVGAAAISLGWYATSFKGAKAFYSLPAGVHASVELPLLLLALIPGFHAVRSLRAEGLGEG